MGVVDADHRRLILQLVTCSPTDSSIYSAMHRPDRYRIVEDFVRVFPGRTREIELAVDSIVDDAGRSKISMFQLEMFLDKYRLATGKAAAEALRREFTGEGEEGSPDFFVFDWLKRIGLTEYAPNFIGNALTGRDDLIASPKLSHAELDQMGISKIGHRRIILKQLDKLIIHSRLDRRSPSRSPSAKSRSSTLIESKPLLGALARERSQWLEDAIYKMKLQL